MPEFNRLIARHQHQLIDAELQRLVGASDSPISLSSSNSSVIHAPAGSTPLIFQVQCKVMHRYCKFTPLPGSTESSSSYSIGSIILFTSPDNNRSLDVGVIVKSYTEEQFAEKLSRMRPFNDREEGEIKRVVRLASEEECRRLPKKHEKEEELLAICQSYAQDVFKLPIVVYGAEFQFDGKVLTFYYTSDVRADYRELVRTMFNTCMVRIMMRKTNQCKKFIPVPFATQALRTGISASGISGGSSSVGGSGVSVSRNQFL